MKKRLSGYILLMMMGLTLCGCKNATNNKVIIGDLGESNKVTPIVTVEAEEEKVEDTTEVIPEGMVRSRLTGLLINEEANQLRPIAIQFNNLKLVGNQWGIGEASILYEAIVEGGITRLLGIFDELKSEKVGSIRSSRHYYVSIADEYDAIYVHYGKTKYAIAKLSELSMDNLDGMTGIESIVFYRDSSIKAPHNAFTSADRIQKGIKSKKYRTEFNGPEDNHFGFLLEDTELQNGTNAEKVTLGYSSYTKPYFVYNSETKLYERFQFDKPHIDSNTKEQLAFKNIIVQFVKEWDIDKNDYQTMDIEDASGSGYYITNGKMNEITWKKKEKDRTMCYYDADGNRLNINPGKTFISLFPINQKNDVVLK